MTWPKKERTVTAANKLYRVSVSSTKPWCKKKMCACVPPRTYRIKLNKTRTRISQRKPRLPNLQPKTVDKTIFRQLMNGAVACRPSCPGPSSFDIKFASNVILSTDEFGWCLQGFMPWPIKLEQHSFNIKDLNKVMCCQLMNGAVACRPSCPGCCTGVGWSAT